MARVLLRAASKDAPAWVRVLATTLSVFYVVVLGLGWLANVPAGHDGMVSPEPHTIDPHAPFFTILEVAPGSPLDRAGVHRGDTVTAVDGRLVGVDDTHQAYHDGRAGHTRILILLRQAPGSEDGEASAAVLTLESRLAIPGILAELLTTSLLATLALAVGVLVVLARPGELAARLLFLYSTVLAFGFGFEGVWHWSLGNASLAGFMESIANASLSLSLTSLLHLFLIFPARHPWYGRLVAIGPPALRRVGGAMPILYILPAASSLAFWGVFLLQLPMLLVVVYLVWRSYRHPPSPLARAQLKWVLWSLVVILAVHVCALVAFVLSREDLPLAFRLALMSSWFLFPLSIAFAVLRYRLFEVDRVVRATITWALLAGLLALGYQGLGLAGGGIARALAGAEAAGDPTVSVIAALAVAAAAYPVRRRLQQGLDRIAYRDRVTRREFLEEAAEVLGRARPPSVVADFLTREATHRLQVAGAWIVLPADVAELINQAASGTSPVAPSKTDVMLDLLADVPGPVLLALPAERQAYSGMPALPADGAALAACYAAGARVLVPLRLDAPSSSAGGRTGRLSGVWALGERRSGELFDHDDLAAYARVAHLAAVLLDYARLHRDQMRQEMERHELLRTQLEREVSERTRDLAAAVREIERKNEELADWNQTLEARVQEQVDEIRRVGRLRRFLSPQVADVILSSGGEDPLLAHRREITVAFCDLRGFTGFAETAEPEDVMDVLREYHARMGEVIFQFEGTLERFAGSSMMVIFNDPVPCPDPAERAVRMALTMRKHAAELAIDWRQRGHELGFGVGIATGYATLGRIGFERRADYGAIGSVTNLAARLCEEAGDGQILITQRVLAAVRDDVEVREVGDLALKGFSRPVAAFQVEQERVSLETILPRSDVDLDGQDLSAREREVATLISRGLTSREIAAELVIAERTADAHAEHIRTKLGLRSRAEIAAWAVQHGLAATPPPDAGATPT